MTIRKPDRAEFAERPALVTLRETAELLREDTEVPRLAARRIVQAAALWIVAPAVIAIGIGGVGLLAGLSDGAVTMLGVVVLPLALSVPLLRAETRRRRERLARNRLEDPWA